MKESSKSSFEISNSFSSMLQQPDHFPNSSLSSMVTTNSSSTKNSTKSNSNSSLSIMYENNLKQHQQQNGLNTTSSKSSNNLGTQGVDVLSNSYSHQLSGNMHSRSHTHLIGPDIIVSSKGCSSSSSSSHVDGHHGPLANSHKNSLMVMHNSTTMMDIKSLQKSSSFTSSLSSGGLKIGSWFDRRARKISMKCSKSMTLGKILL